MTIAEYVNKEAAYDYGTLYDWYISSVSEDDSPVWTGEHIEELLNDFLVIPKETPNADVAQVAHGHWDDSFDGITPVCSVCGRTHSCFKRTPSYCPNCGARMDRKDGDSNG